MRGKLILKQDEPALAALQKLFVKFTIFKIETKVEIWLKKKRSKNLKSER